MSYRGSVVDVYARVGSSARGLDNGEAALRLATNGENRIASGKRKPFICKLLAQFKDVMIMVLLAAALISAAIGFFEQSTQEFIDCLIIVLIVLVNAVIGLIQENKAESALESLREMSTPYAKVLRGGKYVRVKSTELVVGDIVMLEAGDIAPADIRLTDGNSLKVQESTLTGESVAVEKTACDLVSADSSVEMPIGDRRNMVHSASVVTYGRGTGIVTATGMGTEVGKIATMLDTVDQSTPLQKKLDKTGKIISIGVVAIALVIFVVSVLTSTAIAHGNRYINAFMTAIAIAVAAIPEGLPAVVTIVMALGVTRLSRRKAIVRRLPAVETLGCTDVICSDKTGTLTLNRMVVKRAVTINRDFAETDKNDCQTLLRCMTLCNDTMCGREASTVSKNGTAGSAFSKTLIGDPTETALVEYAFAQGVDKRVLDREFARVSEVPFDSNRKLMSTVNIVEGRAIAFTKGAVDELVKYCKFVLDNGRVREMTAADRVFVAKKTSEMARCALRVLGYAVNFDGAPERDMVFVGLTGMIDPPRTEAKDAIRVCRRAGMTAIMITGDHKDTAVAIAKELGMISGEGEVLTGRELDALSDAEYLKRIARYKVYARVSPENKVRIVKMWKKAGKIVAMTGDGVNDAPSIKCADIGIGMGITGTDVTKSIADMVLADDNFATIVLAVEEGRKIYNNIEKSIQFLLSANIAEVVSLFVVTLFFPALSFLIPVQILWVNLITDSFPALALGVEKSERDIMDQPPRRQTSSLFAGRLGLNILYQGLAQSAIVLGVFLSGVRMYDNAVATTMALVALSLIQLFHSFNMRSNHTSVFKLGMFTNPMLWAAFGTGLVLTLAVVGVPALNPIFGTVQLDRVQWAIAILSALLIIPIVEVGKIIAAHLTRKNVTIQALLEKRG